MAPRRFPTQKPMKRYPKKKYYKKNKTGSKYIQKAPSVEKKYINVGVLATGLITTGNYLPLNSCIHGTDIDQRIGNRVAIKSIEFNGTFSTLLPTRFKIIVLVDKQPNGVALNLGNVYLPIAANYFPQVTRNPAYGQRFAILRNYDFVINPQQPQVYAIQKLHKYIKCNIPVTYSGSSGTITDVMTNSIYLIMLVDTVAIASVQCRLRFTDE